MHIHVGTKSNKGAKKQQKKNKATAKPKKLKGTTLINYYYYLFLFYLLLLIEQKSTISLIAVSPTNQLSVSSSTSIASTSSNDMQCVSSVVYASSTVTASKTVVSNGMVSSLTPLQSQLNNDGQCNLTSFSDTSGSFEFLDDNDCPPLSIQNADPGYNFVLFTCMFTLKYFIEMVSSLCVRVSRLEEQHRFLFAQINSIMCYFSTMVSLTHAHTCTCTCTVYTMYYFKSHHAN